MPGVPVVVATNGLGTPVRPVDSGAPLLTVATNGFGVPIVISDLGAPFVVEGLFPRITVTGGTITPFNRSGVDYLQVEFSASGSFNVSQSVANPQIAIGGGGGTGGRGTSVNMGGGGGAGGLLQSTSALLPGAYAFTRGNGGALSNTANAGNSGTDSVLTLNAVEIFRAVGGGRGSTNAGDFAGGSGGGGRGNNSTMTAGGAGTPGQGNSGGAGFADTVGTTYASGGGGGAGGAGGAASASTAGVGGAGVSLTWLDTARTVCAGGDGATVANVAGAAVNYGSGSRGRAGSAVVAGGNGFLFLVVRADQANVVMA